MDNEKFDNLSRLFASGRSRRSVLKGLFAGGALVAVGMTKTVNFAAAQCLNPNEECVDNADCCSGFCQNGTCASDDTCLEDGAACSAGVDCCSGNCDATTGYCGVAGETVCTPDGGACEKGADCCTGNCDATTGYCGVAASGTGAQTSMPATGSGPAQMAGSSLIVPAAALGAAAVLGARRMRATAQDDTQV